MADSLRQRRRDEFVREIACLSRKAIFGTLSESYRTCGSSRCRCHSGGPKHGPHLHVSYRGAHGRTTGYYVPKAAQRRIQEGVAAWQQLQDVLKELAELNRERAIEESRRTRPR